MIIIWLLVIINLLFMDNVVISTKRDDFIASIMSNHHEILLFHASGLVRYHNLFMLGAEDLVQELYLSLMRHWPQSELGFHEKGIYYLFTVLKFDTLDALRKQKSVKRRDEIFSADQPSYTVLDSTTDEIHQVLEKNLDAESLSIMKAYMAGYSYKEIANTHDLPINTVGTRIRRAKKKINDALNL